MRIQTGLDILLTDASTQNKINGNIGYLCHSASVDEKLVIGVEPLKSLFGPRLKKLFGPQHGFVTDVQDNMVETQDYIHPYFNLPVHSLYGETRIPTNEMLEGIDTLIIDLQDVGTRVYTYITTLGLCMQACERNGIKVVVLDRPNPVSGSIIEGAVLEITLQSFVGHHPIPQRHGLTMAEIGLLTKLIYSPKCDYDYIPMKGWNREMFWEDTNRIWINPSPNLPTPNSAITFCGTVLFEGTNISEGRGTTRSLEVLGAPNIDPFQRLAEIQNHLRDEKGFILRPLIFLPTFQKHSNKPCGGFHLHTTRPREFKSWRVGQLMLKWFYHQTDFQFKWNRDPYEYENNGMAIDFINGTTQLREWVENKGSIHELEEIEKRNMDTYLKLRNEILIEEY